MTIRELFGKTNLLIRYNLILVQPLLLFCLLLGVITSPLGVGITLSPAVIIMLVSVFGLFCAFLAGWFNMFHKSIESFSMPIPSKEERAVNSINLFKEFFPGVGKYFLKIVTGSIIYIILFLILMNFIGIIGEKYIGFPKSIDLTNMSNFFMSQEKALEFVSKISQSDKIIIAKWNLLTLFCMGLFSYLTMFWVQAVVIENKNPAMAYLVSLKTVLKHPVGTIVIYMTYLTSVLAISFLGAAYPMNFVIQFIALMILILVLVYYIMLTFLYFEKHRKNNSISRTDSIRQD